MKRRILIVDDERSFGESLGSLLGRDGYELEWVQTGHEAVRRSLDRSFDALVLDLELTDANGWKILDCLCGLHPFLPIIALVNSIEDGEVASLIGAAAWLVKPVDRRVLLKAIQRLMAEPNEERVWRSMDARYRTLRVPEPELAFPG
jgi:DNA-binding response OmpR family regulator